MVSAHLNLKKIWTASLVFYIICSSAFSYGALAPLNTIALYLFFGVSVVNILLKGKVKLDLAVGSTVAYAVLLLVGMLYTKASEGTVQSVMYSYITMMILVVCVIQYIETVRDVEWIVFAYMVAGLALSLYVYSLYGNTFWDLLKEAGDASNSTVDRLGDELTNVNTVGMYAAISAIIATYYIILTKSSLVKKVLCSLIAAFCFIVSMSSASRKGILLILIALFGMWLYGLLSSKNLLKPLRNLVILAAAVIALVYVVMTLPIFSGIAVRIEEMLHLFQEGSGTSSDELRAQMITEGLRVFGEHPLFGAGTNASVYYFGVYSHNNFIEILMNSGVVGFVVFYAMYFVIGYRYCKNASLYKNNSNLSMLLFALFLSVVISSVGFVYYYDRYHMILIAVIFVASKILMNTDGVAVLSTRSSK